MTEDQVVAATCAYLERQGWAILSRCTTKQTGIDIVAERNGRRLLVETKGSAANGAAFTSAQISTRSARAIYAAAKLRCDEPQSQVAIALPSIPAYWSDVAAVDAALNRLKIDVYWVAAGGAVEREAHR